MSENPSNQFNIAIAYFKAGRTAEGLAVCRAILATNPAHAGALHMIGVHYLQEGDFSQAVEWTGRALAADSNLVSARCNLSSALNELGRYSEAIEQCRFGLVIQPTFVELHNNLGVALRGLGQFEEATLAFRQAIILRPTYEDALLNLGNTMLELRRPEDALIPLEQATNIRPDDAQAWDARGAALRQLGRNDEAFACHQKSFSLSPGNVESAVHAGLAQMHQGEAREAISWFHRGLTVEPGNLPCRSNLIYAMHLDVDSTPHAILQECLNWEHYAGVERREPADFANAPMSGRRLRVGFVSPDLWSHPVGRFLLPLLKHRNRDALEFYCYADLNRRDATTAHLAGLADVWCETTGLSDEQLAAQIRNDKIDILFDLALHTAGNRLRVFAARAAPVQAAYLAYLGTSGLCTMDFRLTDTFIEPPGEPLPGFIEKPIWLDATYWCYEPIIETSVNVSPMNRREEVTFGCLNNFSKVNDITSKLWARILGDVPGSRLVLHAPPGDCRSRIISLFEEAGVGASRLEFVARLNPLDYFESYNRIDVVLDTFPFNGGTTTCDALWMGTPVVSLCGSTGVSRASLSILNHAGQAQCIARTPIEYVEIARQLSQSAAPRSSEKRCELREQIRSSRLMDGVGFADAFEKCLHRMVRGSGG